MTESFWSMNFDPRDLKISDYDKGSLASFWDVCHLVVTSECVQQKWHLLAGFLDILSQLTSVGDITPQAFQGILSTSPH